MKDRGSPDYAILEAFGNEGRGPAAERAPPVGHLQKKARYTKAATPFSTYVDRPTGRDALHKVLCLELRNCLSGMSSISSKLRSAKLSSDAEPVSMTSLQR